MFLVFVGPSGLSVQDGGTIVWDIVIMNQGGYYSTETGGYTAAVNGYYQ